MTRLAVSNIAWNPEQDAEMFAVLSEHGVTGIEVAPTKLWPDWDDASVGAARQYRQRLAAAGFEIPALQAIVYGCPDLTVFGGPRQRQGLIDHLTRVADLAHGFGAEVLVFGAPKNRDHGDLDETAAFEQAVSLFKAVGSACAERGTCLCIEPNPTHYGCNFVTDSVAGARLVEAVDSPGFRLHLDAAGMFLAGEDGAVAVRAHHHLLTHFHASEPDLGTFDTPQVDHAGNGRALADSHYSGWVSIEMRATDEPARDVATACALVANYYGCTQGLGPTA